MKHWYELSLLEKGVVIQGLEVLNRNTGREPTVGQLIDAFIALQVWPCKHSYAFIDPNHDSTTVVRLQELVQREVIEGG